VRVDPIKPTLKPPGAKRLKLTYEEFLSSVAFSFNVRCCIKDTSGPALNILIKLMSIIALVMAPALKATWMSSDQ